jgi:hypothetical protein
MKENKTLLEIANNIHIIREQKVMLDRDLANIYDVSVKRINEAIKRNQEKFPDDFCFRLTKDELDQRWSQFATIYNEKTVGYMSRSLPLVFTEQGSYALSFILRSQKATEMGIFIARAFVHLRRFILKNENLMMELKNNDHLSTTFSNFEKRIEQNLIVLYKNNTKYDKEISLLKKRLDEIENKTKK